MTRAGYEIYVTYLATQRHFSTSYDYFKYNGKVKASIDAYNKRNDIYSFEKLSKIIPEKDRIDFFVAHFVENPKEWIRNMSKPKLLTYQATIKNVLKVFREDLNTIKNNDPVECMKTSDGGIPLIHNLEMTGEISTESLILLDWIAPFIDDHAEKVKVPFAWPAQIKKLQKYRPFLQKKLEEDYKYKVSDVFRSVFM